MKCGHRIWHRIVRTVPALGFLGIGLFAFEVQAQFGPPPLPIIETLDKNGDGQIDQDELAVAVASLKALDKDGDGQLTPQELLPDMPFGGPGFGGPGGGRGFGGPGGFGGDERAVLEEYDADKSGWLNKTERAEARKSLASDGGGRGGRRGPGGGRFGGGEPQPGRKVSPDQVAQFPDADLYDTSVLRTIFLEFENADWEKELEAFHGTDVDVPARMTVDGKSYDNVGVHFRGMSSYGMVPTGMKRSLNLTVDYVHSDQELYGYSTLNLLNANGDASLMSTVLYSQIARKYIPAPKANFVHVVINGESWGVFTNVQQFNKDFIKENFGTKQGNRWKVRGNPGADGGLRDLGDDIEEYKRRYTIKSDDSPEAWQDLIRFCKVLNSTPPESLESELANIADVDSILWFLALDVALVNSDGYWTRASDFSIYESPNGKFYFVPHDMNEAFHGGGGPGGRGGRGRGFRPDDANGPTADRGDQADRAGDQLAENRPEPQDRPDRPEAGFGPPGFGPGDFGGGRRGRGGRGFGGPGGGPGGPGHGGVDLDPLVNIDNERMPLRRQLLAVPALKQRYLQCVKTIAHDSLDWSELQNSIAAYRSLIQEEVQQDVKKTTSTDAFINATRTDDSPGSLKSFFEGRRKYLLSYEAIESLPDAQVPAFFAASDSESSAPAELPELAASDVVINEFMASNESTVQSPRGKYSDWIELVNRSGKAVDVSGMYLSDNAHSVQKWKIPEGTVIAPGGYLLIWADEKKSKEGDLHCNFKLAAEGEQIFLSDTDARGNQLLDHVKFGAQDKDVAFGRTADGQQWRSLVPTPGTQNRESK